MKIRKYDLILGFLIILEIVICAYIGLTHGNNYLCTVASNCSYVQNSIYSTLFGMKLAWFGVLCFSILFLLFLIARFNKKSYWMFFAASIIGSGFAIYFILLQAFVLKQFCRECLFIDGIMILMLIIVVFEFVDFRREIAILEKSAEKWVGKAL